MMNTQEWLSQLISIDTTSHRSNLKLITLIKDWKGKSEQE